MLNFTNRSLSNGEMIQEIKDIVSVYGDRAFISGHRMLPTDEWKGVVDLSEPHNRSRWVNTGTIGFIDVNILNFRRTCGIEVKYKKVDKGWYTFWEASCPEPIEV
jgi:hypothetical protein